MVAKKPAADKVPAASQFDWFQAAARVLKPAVSAKPEAESGSPPAPNPREMNAAAAARAAAAAADAAASARAAAAAADCAYSDILYSILF